MRIRTLAGAVPIHLYLPLLILALLQSVTAVADCLPARVLLQVLGSGGPELTDERASSSYLIWVDGRARVLVDAGGGSSINYERAGARFEDLDAIVLTHLHVDHAAELPVYVKGSFFTDRDRDLHVMGPNGAGPYPPVNVYLNALLGTATSAFGYLSDYLVPEVDNEYKLRVKVIDADEDADAQIGLDHNGLRITAAPTDHGPVPALAWRVDAAGCSIAFTGDMTGRYGKIEDLAKGTDLLVAHNAIPEGAAGVAARLHMPPSVIGRIAFTTGAGRLVVSHRMTRTLGREAQTLKEIRKRYRGPVDFAEDLDRFDAAGDG